MRCWRFVVCVWCLLAIPANSAAGHRVASEAADTWVNRLLDVPYKPVDKPAPPQRPILRLEHQDVEELKISQSVIRTPIRASAPRSSTWGATVPPSALRMTLI